MDRRNKVSRSGLFRLITIFSSGFGAASLSLWAVMLNQIGSGGGLDVSITTAVIGGLGALAGAGCAHAYFAGADETTKAYEDALAVDPTTGLLSKSGLDKRVSKLISAKDQKTLSLNRWMLVSIEIDSFRDINDVHGHETGDEVLRLMGGRVSRLVGALGPVARIAGSEFAFAIEIGHDDRELHAVMSAVIDEMARPIRSGNAMIPVFCTAGLVELSSDGYSMSSALRRTNLARTTAKAGGLGNWAIYHPEMTQTDSYRKWIESELSGAIRMGSFDLVYQPQVDSGNGKTVGYEALIRWNHPHRGVIPPSEFISVAEKCGLIGQIGTWVLKQACEDAKHFDPDIVIAVNVSPKQIESRDFVTCLADIFRKSGVDPSQIELEITENILILDHAMVRQKFEEIRKLGCSIAIDDFGTGYSNLGYLAELPFCKLKLDRSLVSRLGEKENGDALVATIVNLAHALNVRILAEGVETEEQVMLLHAAGCTLMQGYYFGKPVHLEHKERIAA